MGLGRKTGRPESYVWKWFSKVSSGLPESSRRAHHAVCTGSIGGLEVCSFQCKLAVISEMEMHILSCPLLPIEAKNEVRGKAAQAVKSDAFDPDTEMLNRKHRKLGINRKTSDVSVQKTLREDFDTRPLKREEIRRLHSQVLRFFVVCGIAFHAAENATFLELMHSLRPTYLPPGVYSSL